MHLYNRVYLLSSLVLSVAVPLVSINLHFVSPLVKGATTLPTKFLASSQNIVSVASQSTFDWMTLLVLAYMLIALGLFIKFLFTMVKMVKLIKTSKTLPYLGAKIILVSYPIIPCSFLNYVFLNKTEFNNGLIDDAIMKHELIHVKQKHSLDIIFIEVLKIIFWINPIFYSLKKLIQLNHEYLADDAVVNTGIDVFTYQYLLIQKSGLKINDNISNKFNYGTLKNRIMMMTKTKSEKVIALKKLACLPLFILLVALFSNVSIAQISNQKTLTKAEDKQEGVSNETMLIYQKLVESSEVKNSNSKFKQYSTFTDAETEKLKAIYLKMSTEQQQQQAIIFIPKGLPLPKSVPTDKQFNSWKDASTYGVWIDDKRIDNKVLSDYQTADFSNAHVSKLSKNAINYGKHYYQVDLMTVKHYNQYYQEAIKEKGQYFLANRRIAK
jgi:bla regulator protein BlaR1